MGAKPGRNDPCPCGSGRKWKVCCGAQKPAPSPVASAETLVREAERLLKAREFERAIVVLLEATRRLPDNPTVWSNLGAAQLVTRHLPEAIASLRRAIALRPNLARPRYHLGLALQHTGDEDAALAEYRRAASLDPKLSDAERKVGDILWEKGRAKEAALAYQRAFLAAPDTTAGRLSGAKALMAEDRRGEAEELLHDLILRDGSNAEAYFVLAHLQNDAGRFDEARANFERSIAIAPKQATAYKGLVSLKRLTESDRPLLEQILARQGERDLGERERMTLRFAAGKAYDDLKDYARATEQWDLANAIRRRLAPNFDREDYARRIDRILARFTGDFFASLPARSQDETPLLILGMPRSGTTLIERILSSHPRIGGGGELVFWRENGLVWADADANKLEEARRSICDAYQSVLRGIALGSGDALRVTDKMPFNFLWVGLVHFVFPRARIIHSRRHPVDTCLSVYSTQFAQDWGFASDRSDLVFYYRQYERLMDHWRTVIPSDRFLEVDYEDVTARPEEAARELVAFAGVEWDEACLRPERNPDAIRTSSKWQARQPVYRSSVERWRSYEPWLGELRELLPA
jgi:tetratricopeptide (TPR) repeat protein